MEPRLRRPALLTLMALLAACGGGGTAGPGPTGPTGPTGPQTQTVMGTTVASSPTSCGGDSHNFEAAEGTVSVTLVQSTGGVGMAVQVCAGGIDNNDCTINLGPIAVGQTVSGARRGGSAQNLKLMPANCGGRGPVAPGPVTYTATFNYTR